MDPLNQPENPVTGADATNPVNAQGEEVETTYQTPVEMTPQLVPTEPIMSEPAPVITETFTAPVNAPLTQSVEQPVVPTTAASETAAPVTVVVPVAKKSRLWLWLTFVVALLALAAVLVFVYVL